MKHIIALAALTFTAGCAVSADADAETMAEDQATLSAELSNYRSAGPPMSCVSLRNLRGNRSAGEGAIIFDGLSGRKWVNRPPAGCPELRAGRALKLQVSGGRLCRGDIVSVYDPLTNVSSGSCGLGDFEPYRRQRR